MKTHVFEIEFFGVVDFYQDFNTDLFYVLFFKVLAGKGEAEYFISHAHQKPLHDKKLIGAVLDIALLFMVL